MQRTEHMLLRVSVIWRWALLRAPENASHDANKTFEILATELLNSLLKFVLGFQFHLLSFLWVFVWLLSSSGVQLAMRGSAVRKPIWESQLALADSTRLLAKLRFLATISSWGCEEDVCKVFDCCLELMRPCWEDDGRWRCLSTFQVTSSLLQRHGPRLCVLLAHWCGGVAVTTTAFKSQCRPLCPARCSLLPCRALSVRLY